MTRAMTSVAPPGTNGTMMRTCRAGHVSAAAGPANAPSLSAEAATSPAKRRRVSIGSSSRTSPREPSEGARFIHASRLVQERLAPHATRHNGPRAAKGRMPRLPRAGWLFALPLRDRGEIGIAIDGLLAHVLPP